MRKNSTLVTSQNLVRPVHNMNKSSLAFTDKLYQERFSASLKFNFKLEFSSLFEADHR